MISISTAVDQLRSLMSAADGAERLSNVHVNYVSPTLHVDPVSDHFIGMDFEDRLSLLQGWLDQTTDSEKLILSDVLARLPISITPSTNEEARTKQEWVATTTQASWVSSFLNQRPPRSTLAKGSAKFVHFYGYKGGQGRSTVLAMLAKVLADDGYRVLVVDADIEAPSLDLIFGVSASTFPQTLMGLCGWAQETRPIAAAYSGRLEGRVDLLPCRPRTENSDLDFAVLVATAPLDSRIYERAADRLIATLAADDNGYDVILVDHRTGIASSILPLMNSLPGAAAVFARTDFNISSVPSELQRVVRSIFASTASATGVFVSFSLDPNRSSGAAGSPSEARVREQLLDMLAMEIEDAPDSEEQISTGELSANWIDWYHDRALLSDALPDVASLQTDNLDSLNRLREVLMLPIGRRRPPEDLDSGNREFGVQTSLSGAKDSGQFIHIPEIEKLLVPGNPFSYILGRKGTGKTRLLREMVARNLGQPLLVASDEDGTSGLQSNSIECAELLKICHQDPHLFWWSLLRIAIERTDDTPIAQLISEFSYADIAAYANRLTIKSLLMNSTDPRTFLVDGLETLVPASSIKGFVAALFELMGTIQNDPSIARKLTIKAFVREDLAADSIQNLEQQIEGRSVRLKWSASSILNFAIARILTLDWISAQYKDVCDDIIASWEIVKLGLLSEQDATELLLRIFPTRLRRNNLSTVTFLRLYFSDAGGDDTYKATFYPRLYLSFLNKLNSIAAASSEAKDVNGRIDSALLNSAYDEASHEFISETKQELSHLLLLQYEERAGEEDDDTAKVAKFIDAFNGLSTPFQHESIVAELRRKTNFTEKSVRESLQRMKSIRMFEDRPGYAGWWRVGQLYKMGLLMKYVRG
ncbi:tyrosine-protein kinase family protein [Burkholderia gladioli]|uniref:tyrosine-protein kinase family protein n=1 Tax=Burkholderia gladioli TaxID=28095 RepID=UPI0011B23EF4|nr:P-loop NTPase [Burkholderia gladioli]